MLLCLIAGMYVSKCRYSWECLVGHPVRDYGEYCKLLNDRYINLAHGRVWTRAVLTLWGFIW